MRLSHIHSYYYSQRGRGYSQEYQAVLTRATALGYTQPSAEQKTKQNTLVQALKDAGIWDLLDVFYVFATDGSSSYALLNWKAPSSFQLTNNNSTTFTSNLGFTGNGTNMYLSSSYGWASGTNYIRDSASFGYYKHTTGQSIADIGTDGAANGQFIGGVLSNQNYYRVNAGGPNNNNAVVSAANGLKHFNRSGASADQVYHNGALIDQSTTASQAIGTGSLTILRRGAAYSAGQIGMVFTGSSLSTKASDLYTAWNAYFTSL